MAADCFPALVSLRKLLLAGLLLAASESSASGQQQETLLGDLPSLSDVPSSSLSEDCEVCSPEAAQFDNWESVFGEDELALHWTDHVSQVRSIGRGMPLQGASWLNRPFHVDWFLGPMLGGDLIKNQVSQNNITLGGLRLGWDFDYFWGLEWRIARADPDVEFNTPLATPNSSTYFISDIDLLYYPWGDSKVRPYALLGLGLANVSFRDGSELNHDATLLTMPYGGGVQFHQWPWLVWRLEVLNNLSFGSDNIATMHNVFFNVGMEFRIGARPSSYWPWRSSRSVW